MPIERAIAILSRRGRFLRNRLDNPPPGYRGESYDRAEVEALETVLDAAKTIAGIR